MASQIALCFLMVCIPLAAALAPFLDCPGNYVTWSLSRQCCSSTEMPKNCECFDISSNSGFTNSFYHKPQCPNRLHVVFRLFTPDNPNTATVIKAGDSSIRGSGFDPSLPTMVVAHGFTDNGLAPWLLQMKDEFMKLGPHNVILVDWKEGAKSPNYFLAVANTRSVGAMVAKLALDLNDVTGVSFKKFHMIGHSLGSQIMGYSGKEVHRLTGQKLGRISGLDPAGPAFEGKPPNVRIDASDAEFVDIFHTDAKPLIEAGFGMRTSVGHVDYFPNGGFHQPGCPADINILDMVDFEDEKTSGACSHGRATDYFIHSINNCRYDSPTDGSFCTMGYHVNTQCRGDHYPKTTDSEPFC